MDEICEACWYQNEKIRYNINGKCDTCGGTSFIDPGTSDDRNLIQEKIDAIRSNPLYTTRGLFRGTS